MPSLLVDHIAALYTNEPALGEGDCGVIEGAWMVVDGDGSVAAVGGGRPPACDERRHAGHGSVIPGFVDSHSHLVFAGDRTAEFAARMSGAAYAAGGIATTVAATRSAQEWELRSRAEHLRDEARRSGTTTIEIKSGYGLTVADEGRLVDIARDLTDEVTFLGAHVVPPEYAGRADDYVALVCGEMLAACAGSARWVDAFCETGAFDAEQCRAVLTAGIAAGLGARLHANQLGHGPGVRLAVDVGCASADHCTYLDDSDLDSLAGSDTVATFLPATDFSTRQPYPDIRRAIDAGVTVALASNCNPGSSYTTSLPFCIALAVRDCGMTIDEALLAATVGGAQALRRSDIGRLAPGCRADFAVLAADTTPIDFVYRPGVPLIDRTVIAGNWPGRDP
jgi:imidazolonepropionase